MQSGEGVRHGGPLTLESPLPYDPVPVGKSAPQAVVISEGRRIAVSGSSTIVTLECSLCAERYDPRRLALLCRCGAPLLARYRLEEAARTMTREALRDRPPTMWRYREVLPGFGDPVSLGEGMTPLHHARRLGGTLGLERLYVKDESLNPTGSFKARGLSAAVTVARELGIREAAIPSAGNAAGALAAYGALAGISVTAFLPDRTPPSFLNEVALFGAVVRIAGSTIADSARQLDEENRQGRWYDVSTLKEPYRIEGKKTMGYELAEQMEGRLPDAIVYPTGGGTGLVGMWKAFDEMERIGWIGGQRPRMISVQAEGCAPIVRAFAAGADRAAPWEGASTYAAGLLVPSARGDFLILEAIRRSGGCALSVTDDEMREGVGEIARTEGIHASPEGGATLAALRKLIVAAQVKKHETIVLFNTGTGLKYQEPFSDRSPSVPLTR